MKKVLLILLLLVILMWLSSRTSGFDYQYPPNGSDPGMPFWNPRLIFGPPVDLARD